MKSNFLGYLLHEVLKLADVESPFLKLADVESPFLPLRKILPLQIRTS